MTTQCRSFNRLIPRGLGKVWAPISISGTYFNFMLLFSHNGATAMALAVLRGALRPLIRGPCPVLFTRCRRHPAAALRLLKAPLRPFK